MRMSHIVICGCSALNIFPHFLKKARFSEKKVIEHKMCVSIFYTTFVVWNISHSKENWKIYDNKWLLIFMKSTRYSCRI